MFKVGLTGGIGAGKSSVSAIFIELGIDVIEADDVAREVVVPGSDCLAAIIDKFGPAFLQTDGVLNRTLLRERIFSSAKDKQWLESLLHPVIRKQIRTQLEEAQSPYCILSSPLLLETQQDALVNKILVVDVPESVQVERASQRDDAPIEQIRAIIDSQMPRKQRLAQADDIIDNTQAMATLKLRVFALHQRYLEYAEHVR